MRWFADELGKAKGGPIRYKGKDLYMSDSLPIGNKVTILVRRIGTNSEWRQGIGLSTNGVFRMGDQISKRKAVFWEDCGPPEARISAQSEDGVLKVKTCGTPAMAWSKPG